MSQFFIRESEPGVYDLKQFGMEVAGADGLKKFRLIIESHRGDLRLEFPWATAFDLVTKLDVEAEDFRKNNFYFPCLVRMRKGPEGITVEAATGALYDFLRERAASGDAVFRSSGAKVLFIRANEEGVQDDVA